MRSRHQRVGGRHAAAAAADVFLEFAAKLRDRILHRPRGSVGQSADRRAGEGGAQDIAIGARASTFSAHGAFLADCGNHDGRTMLDGLLIPVPQGTSSNAFTDTRNAEEVTLTVSGGLVRTRAVWR